MKSKSDRIAFDNCFHFASGDDEALELTKAEFSFDYYIIISKYENNSQKQHHEKARSLFTKVAQFHKVWGSHHLRAINLWQL